MVQLLILLLLAAVFIFHIPFLITILLGVVVSLFLLVLAS
jgi:hypothetical protein